MAPTTPYSHLLGDRDPIDALRQTPEQIRRIAASWSPADFERRYAPGKWTAGQVLTHLAQTEIALGTRARMALTTPDYTAQNFDQDEWMVRESRLTGADALGAFVAVSRMNLALFESLAPSDRAVSLSHPEYGALTIDWIVYQMAGHQIHHLKQLATIRPSPSALSPSPQP